MKNYRTIKDNKTTFVKDAQKYVPAYGGGTLGVALCVFFPVYSIVL